MRLRADINESKGVNLMDLVIEGHPPYLCFEFKGILMAAPYRDIVEICIRGDQTEICQLKFDIKCRTVVDKLYIEIRDNLEDVFILRNALCANKESV